MHQQKKGFMENIHFFGVWVLRNLLTKGEKLYYEPLGIALRSKYSNEIVKNVTILSQLLVFQNYEKSFEDIVLIF